MRPSQPPVQTTVLEATLDLLVSNYLKSRAEGLGGSAKTAIDNAASILEGQGHKFMAGGNRADVDAELISRLMYGKDKIGSKPTLYLDQYERLREWVHGCLDMFKARLLCNVLRV